MAYDFSQYASQATNAYNQALAARPSEASRDTAAARVRSRLQGAQGGVEQQLGDEFAGRGISGSGMYRGELGKSRGTYLGSLSSGLADNEKNYNDSLNSWANTMVNVGQGFAQLGSTSVNAKNLYDQIGVANRNAATGEESNRITAERNRTDAQSETQRNVATLLSILGQYGNTRFNGSGGSTMYGDYSGLIESLRRRM